MKSTKEIAAIAGAVAEHLEGISPSDVERVFKVVRALRGEPALISPQIAPFVQLSPQIAPFVQPVNPAPSLPIGNPWPEPLPTFTYSTACAGNLTLGDVWVDQYSPAVSTTAVLSTETI